MREVIPDSDNPQAFLEAIKFDAVPPNLVDETRTPYLEKTWWTKHQERYFVYWERTKTDPYERPVEAMLGFIAAQDVDSSSMEGAYDSLLSAVITPAETRSDAVESLSKLMGVKSPTRFKTANHKTRESSPQEPETSRGIDLARFHDRLKKATGMEVSELAKLGLWRLESEPFEDNERECLYIVSRHSHKALYPCLKFDAQENSWWQKDLDYTQQTAVAAVSRQDEDYASMLVAGTNGWKRVGFQEITELTEELSNAPRSL